MLTLGTLTLGPVPRIAAPVTDTDVLTHAELVHRYADIAELRIDQFARHDPDYAAEVCRAASVFNRPLIATVRAADEGGAVSLSDEQRLGLFDAVMPLVAAVDIELKARICERVVDLAHEQRKSVIISHHDFAATPSDADLAALYDAAVLSDADIVKIVAHAASTLDADRLLQFLRARRERGLIVIGMGPHGVASRVFFPLLGSLITYGFVGAAMAPGQLPLAELYEELQRYSPEFAVTHA